MTRKVTLQELQLAAKAANFPVEFEEGDCNGYWPLGRDDNGDVESWWNPTKDNGDALQLAAAIKQDITFLNGDVMVLNACEGGTDTLEQLRMAIFYAAVEIGRGMP